MKPAHAGKIRRRENLARPIQNADRAASQVRVDGDEQWLPVAIEIGGDETREPITMAVIGVIFAWWLIRMMQARH